MDRRKIFSETSTFSASHVAQALNLSSLQRIHIAEQWFDKDTSFLFENGRCAFRSDFISDFWHRVEFNGDDLSSVIAPVERAASAINLIVSYVVKRKRYLSYLIWKRIAGNVQQKFHLQRRPWFARRCNASRGLWFINPKIRCKMRWRFPREKRSKKTQDRKFRAIKFF